MNIDEPKATHDYDIAVSFAGEDRDYVEKIVRRLQRENVSIFYDQDQLAAMWGENLIDFLDAVYVKRARFTILFVSRHYAEKKWPDRERQSAQERALQQNSTYILPIRLDDTRLPGLSSTIGYLDSRQLDIEAIIAVVMSKLGLERVSRASTLDDKVPRTADGIAALLSARPPGWEYLLFGGLVKQGIATKEPKYRDHSIGYARSTGVSLNDDESVAFMKRELSALRVTIDSFNRILQSEVQEAAFGKPGEPGDPDRIVHLSQRFVSVYEDLMDWAAKLRGTGVSDDALRRAIRVQSRFVDQSLTEIRSFVETLVAQLDTVQGRLAKGESVRLSMVISISIGDDLVREHSDALAAYRA